jgi:hypothetical protein
MALEFCSRACACGSDVEFVQTGNEKTPDVRMRLADRWVTIEFKALHENEEIAPWYEFEQTLMNLLIGRGVVATTFDRELTPLALSDPEAVADGLAAVAAGSHHEYQPLPRGTGRARLAAINSGLTGYPVVQQTELVRLVSKLRSKWWKQLASAEGPTLLVVRTSELFGRWDAAAVGRTARSVTDAVRPALSRLPMVGGVLVYDEPFWAPIWPAFAEQDDFRVRMETSPAGCARFMVLVSNPAAHVTLNRPELDRLVPPEPDWAAALPTDDRNGVQ